MRVRAPALLILTHVPLVLRSPRKLKLAVEVKTDKLGNRVRMIAFLPENVPLEKREAVMEYLIGVNHTNGNGSSIASAGHFDMDVEDGEVRFRVAVSMDGFNKQLLSSLLSNMLDAVAETGDNWSQITNLMR